MRLRLRSQGSRTGRTSPHGERLRQGEEGGTRKASDGRRAVNERDVLAVVTDLEIDRTISSENASDSYRNVSYVASVGDEDELIPSLELDPPSAA